MRKLIFIVLLVALSLISACSSGNNTVGAPFVGGEKGLVMSFSPASPPDQIFDDNQFPFSVAIEIENQGEYDLKSDDGYVELEGINGETFGVSDSSLVTDIPAIDGTRKNYDGTVSNGLKDVIVFNNLNYQENLRGDLAVDLRASACYNYQTKTSTNICIKKESIDNINENEICTIGGDKQVQNSGGPVHITKVTQTPQGRESIQVLFVIEHVGDANTFFYREDAVCDTRVNNPQKYQVYVEVEPIIQNGVRAQCSGFQEGSGDAGYVTLFNGLPRTVTCSFDTSRVNRDFVEPLNINLRYRYQQFIQKQLIIKDVSTND